MNWKLALILLLIFSTITVATATISLNLPSIDRLSTSESRLPNTDLQLQGDPIGNPGGPH